MKNIFSIAGRNPLFKGLDENEFVRVTKCLSARTARFKKDETVFFAGDEIKQVGLVLSGKVVVVREDGEGREELLAEFSPPDLFGEVFACAGVALSPVTVRASEDAEILLMNFKRVVSACAPSCEFHTRLTENMLSIVARKCLMMNQKIEILSKRTTREKLIALFDLERGSSKKFTLSYNREETARYLCVDRSAMSSELSRMRDEGLIKFRRNEFEILY